MPLKMVPAPHEWKQEYTAENYRNTGQAAGDMVCTACSAHTKVGDWQAPNCTAEIGIWIP